MVLLGLSWEESLHDRCLKYFFKGKYIFARVSEVRDRERWRTLDSVSQGWIQTGLGERSWIEQTVLEKTQRRGRALTVPHIVKSRNWLFKKRKKKEREKARKKGVKDRPGKEIKSFDFNLCVKKSHWVLGCGKNKIKFLFWKWISVIYEGWICIVGELVWKFSPQSKRQKKEISMSYENKLKTTIPISCNHYNSLPTGLYLINAAQCLANNRCSIQVWLRMIALRKFEGKK